ncbi:MAG: CBS domain-containing protein, partial [Myxococcales bacterium]
MSSPVRAVEADTPLVELERSLKHWRHTGVPVLRDGSMIGIVSRRDVEAARRDGRLHLGVSSCMSQNVKTTTPDAPLEDALAAMVSANVGRLPVLKDGHLVGIVTRSDLLRFLYRDGTEPRP